MIDYDAHHWRSHLLDIRGSMLREILGRVSACVLWSVVVVTFHHRVHPVGVPASAHGLVGIALGLLLVFRTNVSYDRFWEGRRQWGAIIAESRNLARAAHAPLVEEPGLYQRLLTWTVAYAYAAMHRLRGTPGIGPAVADLPPREVAAVLAAQHVPLAVSVRISAVLAEARDRGRISDVVFVMLDRHVRVLVEALCACERIHRTPLPFVYVVHLRRALILYCFTLPFALVREFGWISILDTLFVAYLFFGIEEIGVEIEDPFGNDPNDLPLESICATIEANLDALRPERAQDADPAALLR